MMRIPHYTKVLLLSVILIAIILIVILGLLYNSPVFVFYPITGTESYKNNATTTIRRSVGTAADGDDDGWLLSRTTTTTTTTTATKITTKTIIEKNDNDNYNDGSSSSSSSRNHFNNNNNNQLLSTNTYYYYQPPPDIPSGSCQYDGHCPVGATCAIPPPSLKEKYNSNDSIVHGICEPIIIVSTTNHSTTRQQRQPSSTDTINNNNANHNYNADAATNNNYNNGSLLLDDECYQNCYNALLLDEYYYYRSTPIIERKERIRSSGRPNGCILIYNRSNNNDKNQTTTTTSTSTIVQEQQLVEKLKFQMEQQQQQQQEKNRQHQNLKSPLSDEPSGLRLYWVTTRLKHIIRVDPYNNNDNQPKDDRFYDTNQWMAYCYNPCQNDNDCRTPNDDNNNNSNDTTSEVTGFVCRSGTCERNPFYWNNHNTINNNNQNININNNNNDNNNNQKNKHHPNNYNDSSNNIVLVSGATSQYFKALRNFVQSANYWAPKNPIVVYNLGGLSTQRVREIRSWSNVLSVEWEDGIPSYYPSHVRMGKVYAWKPIVINETIHKYKSIFWWEAGSIITGPILPAIEIMQRHGILLVNGQDCDMTQMSHNKTYEWFNVTKSQYANKPHYAGGVQGHVYPSRYIDTIVIPNARCAFDVNCINPIGSSYLNHRYDQTTLSILANQLQIPPHTEYLGGSPKNSIQPSFAFINTARGRNLFYAYRDQYTYYTSIQRLIPIFFLLLLILNPYMILLLYHHHHHQSSSTKKKLIK